MYINKTGYSPVAFKRAFYSEDFKTEYSRKLFKDTEDGDKLDRMVDSFTKLSDKKNKNVKVELNYDDRERKIGFIFGRIWDKGIKFDMDECQSCGTVFELQYDTIDSAIKNFKDKVNGILNQIPSKKS